MLSLPLLQPLSALAIEKLPILLSKESSAEYDLPGTFLALAVLGISRKRMECQKLR